MPAYSPAISIIITSFRQHNYMLERRASKCSVLWNTDRKRIYFVCDACVSLCVYVCEKIKLTAFILFLFSAEKSNK